MLPHLFRNFRKESFYCFFIIFIFLSFFVRADGIENYYTQHAIGWHWYQNPVSSSSLVREDNPSIQLQQDKIILKQLLDKAILDPSVKNLIAYISLQNVFSKRAEIFAQNWEKSLLISPQLNYSLVHPINTLATQIYYEKRFALEENQIKQWAKTKGMLFFYKGTCIFCQKFAPILKNFIQHYGFTLLPISVDGNILLDFPDSLIDRGQSRWFPIYQTPALFIVNPYSKKIQIVAYGLVTEADLRKRILELGNI